MPSKNPATLGAIKMATTSVTGAGGVGTGTGELLRYTTEVITVAAGVTYTIVLTNPRINTSSTVIAKVKNGTSVTGVPNIATVTEGNGSVTILIQNISAAASISGTIVIDIFVLNPV